jgi:hypothetical protein
MVKTFWQNACASLFPLSEKERGDKEAQAFAYVS